jgi:hypothetical protein
MNEQIKEIIDKFPVEILDMFHDVTPLYNFTSEFPAA